MAQAVPTEWRQQIIIFLVFSICGCSKEVSVIYNLEKGLGEKKLSPMPRPDHGLGKHMLPQKLSGCTADASVVTLRSQQIRVRCHHAFVHNY